MQKPVIRILVLFAVMMPQIAFPQQKFALLIGINKYYDKPGVLHAKQLAGCVNDALSMKSLFHDQFGFLSENIHTLLDSAATKKNLMAVLLGILAQSKKGDAVVFYFSGHGAWMFNRSQSAKDTLIKGGMNQAMVMSDLYAEDLDCLVRDATLKKIANLFVDKGVVFTAITDCCFSGLMVMPARFMIHNPYSPVEAANFAGNPKMLNLEDILNAYTSAAAARDSLITATDVDHTLTKTLEKTDEALRGFNLKDGLVIHDSSYIIPPSARAHSRFLGLNASGDNEFSLEVSDETGAKHGIYTKALLSILRSKGPELPVSDLVRELSRTMITQQYVQHPKHHEDPARLSGNLIGMPARGFSNSPGANILAIAGKNVELDGGLWAGITVGNTLRLSKNGGPILHVYQSDNDHADATIVSGTAGNLKAGDRLYVTDSYTVSAPLFKLCIGSAKMSAIAFQRFFDEKLLPLSRRPNYMSYEDWWQVPSDNILYNESFSQADSLARRLLAPGMRDSFIVMLPIPKYFADSLKAVVNRNQNLELVSNPADADYMLYFNFVRGKRPHFVFTWDHRINRDSNKEGELQFINRASKTKAAALDLNEVNALGKSLANAANDLIRERSNRWLNFMPRR